MGSGDSLRGRAGEQKNRNAEKQKMGLESLSEFSNFLHFLFSEFTFSCSSAFLLSCSKNCVRNHTLHGALPRRSPKRATRLSGGWWNRRRQWSPGKSDAKRLSNANALVAGTGARWCADRWCDGRDSHRTRCRGFLRLRADVRFRSDRGRRISKGSSYAIIIFRLNRFLSRSDFERHLDFHGDVRRQ